MGWGRDAGRRVAAAWSAAGSGAHSCSQQGEGRGDQRHRASRELALGDRLAGKLLLLGLGLGQAGGAKLAAPQHLAQLVVSGHILREGEGRGCWGGGEGRERSQGADRFAGGPWREGRPAWWGRQR